MIPDDVETACLPAGRNISAVPARSYLIVAGNHPERFDEACAVGADAVIVDLEDAVPPPGKRAAREALVAWASPTRPVLARINSADSPWFHDDLALCKVPGIAGLVLPKAEQEKDLAAIAAAGAQLILPMIESAAGMWNAAALARAPRVERLVFGTLNISADLGITQGDEALLYFRSRLVLVSRVAGILAPVDGVEGDIDDLDRLRQATGRARAHGFGGKLCSHPAQVAIVSDAFAPSAAELDWAARLLDAASKADGEGVALDGKMVDRRLILIAEQMMDEALRRATRTRLA